MLVTGCATRHTFTVEAINQADRELSRQSFLLLDARAEADLAEPAFRGVEKDLLTALSGRGFYAAPKGVAPEMLIEVDFGMSAPIVTHHVRVEPVEIMAASAQTFPMRLSGQTAPLGTTRPLVVHQEVPFTVTTYEKFLRLTARDLPRGGDAPVPPQIWSVLVTNRDASDDLATYLPLMIAAAMDSAGRDFEGEQRVVLTGRDGRVAFVQQGMEAR